MNIITAILELFEAPTYIYRLPLTIAQHAVSGGSHQFYIDRHESAARVQGILKRNGVFSFGDAYLNGCLLLRVPARDAKRAADVLQRHNIQFR